MFVVDSMGNCVDFRTDVPRARRIFTDRVAREVAWAFSSFS